MALYPLPKLPGECFLEPLWQRFPSCSRAIALVLLFPWPCTCKPQRCCYGGSQGKRLPLVAPSFPSSPGPSLQLLGLRLGKQYMHAESSTAKQLNSVTCRNEQLGVRVAPEENGIVTVGKIGKILWGKHLLH